MPPPSSFAHAHTSPTSGRGDSRPPVSATDVSPDGRDGGDEPEGDAEMDELMDEELGAAADAATTRVHRSRVKGESP